MTEHRRREVVDAGDVDIDREEVYDIEGDRVDQAYIDQAVADLEASRGRGRPSLQGRGKHGRAPQIAFRVQPGLRAKAQARARKEGKTVSALAREAFEHYLA